MEMKDLLRSPRETMLGWVHLPRYIDKIRLHLRGELAADYVPSLGNGFDGMWLKAAGLEHDAFVAQVKQSVTDGQVAAWVRKNVKADANAIEAFNRAVLSAPNAGNAASVARLEELKAEGGFANPDAIRTFVDLVDADEGRI